MDRSAESTGAVTHNSTTLVSENDGEDALGRSTTFISATCLERLCMRGSLTSGSLPLRVYSSVWQIPAEIHD